MKTIELVINTAGDTQLQTQGFQGSECKAASAALEKALGLVTQDMPTTAYFSGVDLQVQRQSES